MAAYWTRTRTLNTTVYLRGLAAAVVLLAASPTWGQRVQFPTMVVADNSTTSGAPIQILPMQPLVSVTQDPPTVYTVAQAPPAVYPGYPQQPPATFGGVPATPPPAWDAYAPPPAAAPTYSPYSPSPYAPPPLATQPIFPGSSAPAPYPQQGGFYETIQQPLKFLQEVRGRYTWLPQWGSGSNVLGVNDVEVSATFAVPFFYNQSPLLITPGFATHFWQGPQTTPPSNADLPGATYDGYLDLGWQPQVTPWLGFNFGGRIGVYTDFSTFTNRSIREMGRAIAVLSVTQNVQVLVGVVYIDRNYIKLLPAGGVVWTPNPDSRYEFLFPNPRLARRYTTLGTTDIWYFLAGEYGGGAWTVSRAAGFSDSFDYNDIRVSIGLEAIAVNGVKGSVEIGYVFDRQLRYRSGLPAVLDLNDTMMLRASFAF
jgi:hypothetical protein